MTPLILDNVLVRDTGRKIAIVCVLHLLSKDRRPVILFTREYDVLSQNLVGRE